MNYQEQIRLLQDENESLKRRFERKVLTGNEIAMLQIIIRSHFDLVACTKEQAEILKSLAEKLELPKRFQQDFELDFDFEYNT